MLEYHALGALGVVKDGDEVGVGGPRQRRLLAMLLLHRNAVVSADRLAEAVFAGAPTPAVATTLRSYVARLRRVVDDSTSCSTVVTQAPGYMLRVSDEAFDVACFERLLAEGRSQLAHDDAVAASSAFRQALILWRGDAYAEFADEDWVRPEAQRLGELRLVVHEHLIDAELACGLAAELIPQLETLVAEDPLREAFRSRLMVAFYRSGRQVDALRVLQGYRRVLADEVGLDPSPELVELERRILVHDEDLQLAEPAGRPLRGYRLGERLGTGRDGTVYAGRLPGVAREFAIRIVPPEIADRPEFVRSFDATAQRVASLRHEAVVPIHDHWREPGAAYVVMRRMRGGTLRDRIERGPVATADVAALVARIGAALEAAADHGIVHARVVPESVLFDDTGAGYLADFVLGNACASRHSDDVRAFAALVGEALTGRRPIGASIEGVPAPVAGVLAGALSGADEPPVGQFVPALVAAFAAELGRGAVASAVVPANPYKGLRAFDESDAADFFGREGLVEEMLRRLAGDGLEGRLLLVVGGSGSGKSSAVRAGLLPRVRVGDVAGSRQWFVTTMLPGGAPFKELAEGLRRVAVAATDDVANGPAELSGEGLADTLSSDERGIDAVLRRIVPGRGQLLLVVDQLEELFTLASEAEQRAFLEGMMYAVSAADSRLRVVATLRADFYDRPLRFQRLGAAVRDATVTVPAMAAAELEAAVVGPAERVGAHVEPPLVAELVAAVVGEPAALPSLQFTLYELAERSADRRLRLAVYRQLGGVDGAIASRADELYRSLDDAERSAVRRMFERLVVIGVEGEPTRRRAPRSELATLIPGQSVDDVVEGWAQARLLSLDRHPTTREPTVEVAHEALLREWPRLRRWIEEDREAIVALGQLREAAVSWIELDHDPGALYRGARLEATLALTEGCYETLPAAERDFLAASNAVRDEEERRETERIERQARANRRLRAQLAAIAVALVVALVVGFVAVDQRRRAEREGRVAVARELAAAATANLDEDPERSILLALAAIDRTRSADGSVLPEAEEALHRAVTASRIVLSVPGLGGLVDWSPDGTVFVTEGPEESGLVDIRDVETGESVLSFRGHDVDLNDVAFSADGSLVATAGDDGALRVWDPTTGEELASLVGAGDVWGPSFSPDGSRLAASWPGEELVRVMELATGETVLETPWVGSSTSFSPDGERIALASATSEMPVAVVVDAQSGVEMLTLGGHDWEVLDVAWSPDGRWIATASADLTARIWDAETGELRSTLFGHTGPIISVDWSADATRLATGSEDGTARVWQITAGGTRRLLTVAAHDTSGGAGGVAFSPDGEHLLTGDAAITAAKVWDVGIAGDAQWANIPVPASFLGTAAFTPDGRRLVATGAGGTVTVWNVGTGAPRLTLGEEDPSAHPSMVDAHVIEVSPDGRLFATSSYNGPARMWDARSGHEMLAAGPGDWVDDVAWSPDSRLLAVAGGEGDRGVVTIVNRSGDEVAVLPEDPGATPLSVQFSPDGRRLVTSRVPLGRYDPTIPEVRIWDWERGEVVGTIDTAADVAVFDPTGTRIATTSVGEGVAVIWDAETGRTLATLAGHKGRVLDIVFAPDGSVVATASADGTARLWDAESGAQVLALRGHQGPVGTVVFSPDGSRLASVSVGTARVWALHLDDLIEIARGELTRTLTGEECQQYLHVDQCPRAQPSPDPDRSHLGGSPG